MTSRVIAVVALFCAVSCGGSSPSAPSAPVIAQLGGNWRGTETLTGGTGGECVGAVVAGAIGTPSAVSTFAVAIQQTGTSLTATTTDTTTGGTCTYTGTAGTSSATLNWQRCDLGAFRYQCPNGAIRDVQLQASSINVTLVGTNALNGTIGETYNITSAITGAAVSVLIVNSNISATRQ